MDFVPFMNKTTSYALHGAKCNAFGALWPAPVGHSGNARRGKACTSETLHRMTVLKLIVIGFTALIAVGIILAATGGAKDRKTQEKHDDQ